MTRGLSCLFLNHSKSWFIKMVGNTGHVWNPKDPTVAVYGEGMAVYREGMAVAAKARTISLITLPFLGRFQFCNVFCGSPDVFGWKHSNPRVNRPRNG